MSISSVANTPNPILLSLLSQLSGPSQDDFSADDGSDVENASSSNALTGSTKAALGGQILQTLISMQQDGGAAVSGTDPVQSLFSSMDTNGDGQVSQSEMENAIEQDGGTQTQADALYQTMGGTSASSGGLDESQFASAAQQGASSASAAHHHHHHGHGHGGGGDALENILDAADANTGSTSSTTTSTNSTETNLADAANGALSSVTSPFQSLMNDLTQPGSLASIAV